MKNTAITRKIVVENGTAMVAIQQHISQRATRHNSIVKKATEAGIIGTLAQANKSIACNGLSPTKKHLVFCLSTRLIPESRRVYWENH